MGFVGRIEIRVFECRVWMSWELQKLGRRRRRRGGMELGFRAMIGYLRERMDSWFMTVGSMDGVLQPRYKIIHANLLFKTSSH